MKRWAALLPLLLVAGCAPGSLPFDGHTPVAVSSDRKAEVVALGDSVPAGSACDCTPFPQLYATMVGAGLDNLAVPGYTSQDVLDQLSGSAAGAAVGAASVVLVMAGANDLADAFDNGDSAYDTPAATVQKNVKDVVNEVHTLSPGASVLVLGYWNVVEDGAVGREDYSAAEVADSVTATQTCNDSLRKAATDAGATYVDTAAAFKGDGGDQDPTKLLADDGDHPNAAGHQAIADVVYKALPGG